MSRFFVIPDAGGTKIVYSEYAQLQASGLADILIGSDADEIVSAFSGDDYILGLGGADQIYSDAGNDFVDGGAGNDTLDGGSDNDILNGGSSIDTYIFDAGWGVDIITDLDITGKIIFDGVPHNMLTFSNVNGSLVITDSINRVTFDQYYTQNKTYDFIYTTAEVDVIAPLLNSLSPVDNATGVPLASNLVLTFNDVIQAGTGNITIYNANGTLAKTIAVTDSSQVTISGDTLTINSSTDLASGSSYYVNIPSGVIKDLAGNAFSGITDSTTYNFTTLLALPVTSSTRSYPGHSMGEFSNASAFAVIKADGSVVTWGTGPGGDSSAVASQLNGTIDVTQVFSSWNAFAALRADGSIVTWGEARSDAVASQLDGTIDVTQAFSTGRAFAALRADGSVVTWGIAEFGGDSNVGHYDDQWNWIPDHSVASQLNGTIDVTQVFSTISDFAALRADGSVVTWGAYDSRTVASQLNGTIDVTQVFSTFNAFAALLADGSVVSWGDAWAGGDSSAVASQLNGTIDVTQVFSTDYAFAALRADGSVVTWGNTSTYRLK